jgi:anti-sigma B factor antagonist
MSTLVKEIRNVEGTIVLMVTGELTFEHSPGFHRTLVEVYDQKPPHIIIDFSDLTYIDSSGVGTLVDILRKTKAQQIKFSLVGLRQTVRSVFEITKLDRVFPIYDGLDEACQS